MAHWDKTNPDSYTVTVYGEHFEQGEPFQSYTVSSKETAKELIQQILRRNHLNLKDPNLFYLTFHIDPRYMSTNYEPMTVPRININSNDRAGAKSQVGTLYSDAILSRTLDLTKDNRITLHMQPGGMLRVYDNCFSKPPSIRQLYISKTTSSEEVINLVMTIVGSSELPEDYCLVEEDANDGGRILREKDYPLLVSRTSGHNGVLILRRKYDAFQTDRIRRRPWVARSKSFSGRHNSSDRTPTNEQDELNQPEPSQFCRPLNLLPRIFRSLRRNKTFDIQKRDPSPKPLITTSTPSSLRQSPRDRSRSPQRTVHYDCDDKFVDDSLVNRSLINPHYRPLCQSRTPTSADTRATMNELDQTMSNWSLAPSGFISPPLGRTPMRTPPLQVPHRVASSTVDSRRTASSWTRGPPRPPLPKRAVNHGEIDRQPHGTSIHHGVESFRRAEATLGRTIYDPQQLPSFNRKHTPDEVLEEQLLEESLSTTAPSNGSIFDPRTADDSALTELERVWARKRVTKTRTVRQIAPLAVVKQELSRSLLPRDYDSPAELTSISDTSRVRGQGEINGMDTAHETFLKSNSSMVMLDLHDSAKVTVQPNDDDTLVQSTTDPGKSSPTGRGNVISSELTILNQDHNSIAEQDRTISALDAPRQHPNLLRPTAHSGFVRQRKQDPPERVHRLPVITGSNGESTKSLIKGSTFKTVVSHEQTMVSTENITQTKEALGSSARKSGEKAAAHQNFLSQEVSVQSPSINATAQIDEHNSNVTAVTTEKMMTLTTHIQAEQDPRTMSMSKLTIELPDTPRPSSVIHPVNEKRTSRPRSTTTSTVNSITPSTTPTTPSTITTSNANHTVPKPVIPPVASKRNPPEVMEKPRLCLSNGSIPSQSWTTETKVSKPEVRPDAKSTWSGDSSLNKFQTFWPSVQSPEDSFGSMQRTPYPTLFDVLHHCNIIRVVLDPNIPSRSNQLGLQLGLSKFPLDDIQRANNIQRMQQQQQQQQFTGSKDTLTSIGSENQYGPKGPKPRIRPREGSAFRAVDYRRLEDAPDVVTIERVDPDSPAAIEGELTAGTLLLEINGKTLLQSADATDSSSCSLEMLRFAEEQLKLASQAGRVGEAPLVRITAAKYHSRFGVENKMDKPEKTTLANRRFIIGKAMSDADLESQVMSWRKTPSSIASSDINSSRPKSDVSFGDRSFTPRSDAGNCTPINENASRRQSLESSGPKDGLVWFPTSRITFKTATASMDKSAEKMRKNGISS